MQRMMRWWVVGVVMGLSIIGQRVSAQTATPTQTPTPTATPPASTCSFKWALDLDSNARAYQRDLTISTGEQAGLVPAPTSSSHRWYVPRLLVSADGAATVTVTVNGTDIVPPIEFSAADNYILIDADYPACTGPNAVIMVQQTQATPRAVSVSITTVEGQ